MTYTKRLRAGAPMGDDDPWGGLLNAVKSPFDALSIIWGGSKPDQTDNVNQTAGGGSATSAADFTTVSGICKPKNFPALNAAREFQRQMNRVAQAKGFGKVSPDGAIGPSTLALFRRVQALAPGSVTGDPGSCMGVAPDVDVLIGQVKAVADSLGAPVTVSGPVAITVPSVVTNSGKTVVPPDAGIVGMLGSMSGIEKVALLGVAGGIGYLVMTGRKRRRGRR